MSLDVIILLDESIIFMCIRPYYYADYYAKE